MDRSQRQSQGVPFGGDGRQPVPQVVDAVHGPAAPVSGLPSNVARGCDRPRRPLSLHVAPDAGFYHDSARKVTAVSPVGGIR